MKRRITRFDQFLVWHFTMNKGDVKTFTREEITRGLTTYGDMTMNSISVFVKGSFVTHRDGMPPLYSYPGDGGARFVIAKSLEGFAVEALEDGSEYHCITPRDAVARFWERQVQHWDHGYIPINKAMIPGHYIYVAAGEVTVNKTKIAVGQLARIKTLCDMTAWNNAITVEMWPHNEPQI